MLLAAGAWVFLTWLEVGVILVGIGSIGLRWFGPNWKIGDAFWLGLCGAVALLPVWSLLLRMTRLAAASLAAISLIGLAINGSRLLAGVRRAGRELRSRG